MGLLLTSSLFVLIFAFIRGAFNPIENAVADIDKGSGEQEGTKNFAALVDTDEGSGEQLGTKKIGAVVDIDEGSGEQLGTKKKWKIAAVGKYCMYIQQGGSPPPR